MGKRDTRHWDSLGGLPGRCRMPAALNQGLGVRGEGEYWTRGRREAQRQGHTAGLGHDLQLLRTLRCPRVEQGAGLDMHLTGMGRLGLLLAGVFSNISLLILHIHHLTVSHAGLRFVVSPLYRWEN